MIMGRAGCGGNRTSGSEGGLRKPGQSNLTEGAAARPHTFIASSIRGQLYRLYLVMDVFSRKILGWEVQENESDDHSRWYRRFSPQDR